MHVITVYASAAFVIIELIGNLAAPLNLPPNLPTIVNIVLAVGFPLAIVLSWIYDLTSEGVEKTLHEQGFVTTIEELLRLNEMFGKPGCQMGDDAKMYWYLQVNDYEKALDYLEKLFEASFTNIPYLLTNFNKYEQLKVYPRYIEILKNMNLPLPED